MHTGRYVGIVLRRIRRGMKNKAKKAVSKAMKEKTEEVLSELTDVMFSELEGSKIDGKEA